MIIVLLGPPGCGKGTQSQIMCEEFGLCKISTGDILRKNIVNGTDVGLKAKSLVDNGEFVDDKMISTMVEAAISESKCDNGFIADGFPRNLNQAKDLDFFLIKLGLKIDFVFEFILEKNNLLERIIKRSKENNLVRKDDNKNVFQKRIEIYDMHTKPVVPFYDEKGILKKIDASKTIASVSMEINSIINNTNK
tara:strand:+ start:165 stop:743 length:579 start_codon:yes stop_codon:yes gene_type:complete